MSSFPQFEELAQMAEKLALAYTGSKKIIRKKRLDLKKDEYSLTVEQVTLFPGYREVIVRISFPDKDSFEVHVNVDKNLIKLLKYYPEQNKKT
jgi:hypothetical protein